ncbi:HK97-gp10 family putative phage morphogenesis protein [Clostridium tetani]|uniref:HK97-gp10 family putative phage morphogenesis protein n=1 Tax=Clostridium tetani TaxID=1513 RepID=UPI0024A8707B|nr:HK97-gp10 family putative phage morphogenesis protein [Clostridium tetani]
MKYINNIRQVKQALNKAIEDSLHELGVTATTNTQAVTPVDTGKLRRSITHKTDSKNLRVYVGTNVQYAINVHEGTSKQKANPFITNGIKETQSSIRDILKKNFNKNIGR